MLFITVESLWGPTSEARAAKNNLAMAAHLYDQLLRLQEETAERPHRSIVWEMVNGFR